MSLDCDEAVSLKERVLGNIDKYLKHVERVRILAIATLLDPRFKKLHFESALAAANAVTWTSKYKDSLKKISDIMIYLF